MVYRSLKVSIEGDESKSFYIGEDGYIYVFFDDYYFNSCNTGFFDISLDGIVNWYKIGQKVMTLSNTIYYKDYAIKDITIMKNNNSIVNIPYESASEILDVFSNLEVYFIGCDDNASDQIFTFTEDVLYYHKISKDGYVLRINYTNNRYWEVYITLDGSVIYGYDRLYKSITIDKINYYTYIEELLQAYNK